MAPQLLTVLRDFADSRSSEFVDAEALEQEVDELFSVQLQHGRQIPPSGNLTLQSRGGQPQSGLKRHVCKQARARGLRTLADDILGDGELQGVWVVLHRHRFRGEDEEDLGPQSAADTQQPRINYDGFAQAATECRELLGNRCDPYFLATTFLKFEPDAQGCIPLTLFLRYMTQHADNRHLRHHLSFFDDAATGKLDEAQLARYLERTAGEVPCLQDMPAEFLPHYLQIAARKLLFFHGRRHSGGQQQYVAVRDLVTSPVLQELLELRSVPPDDPNLTSNWFSQQSTNRVLATFQQWDQDLSSTLNRDEFSNISQGSMTDLFISRIFEEHVGKQRDGLRMLRGGRSSSSTARDEMDLMDFVDFVLAWDHRNHPAALRYFFAVFDLKKQGVITPAELYTFFKEIHVLWVDKLNEYAELSVNDVIGEIIDMISPASPPNITLQDLARCKMAGTVFSVLSNVQQFFEYNYRENFMHSDDDQ